MGATVDDELKHQNHLSIPILDPRRSIKRSSATGGQYFNQPTDSVIGTALINLLPLEPILCDLTPIDGYSDCKAEKKIGTFNRTPVS